MLNSATKTCLRTSLRSSPARAAEDTARSGLMIIPIGPCRVALEKVKTNGSAVLVRPPLDATAPTITVRGGNSAASAGGSASVSGMRGAPGMMMRGAAPAPTMRGAGLVFRGAPSSASDDESDD